MHQVVHKRTEKQKHTRSAYEIHDAWFVYKIVQLKLYTLANEKRNAKKMKRKVCIRYVYTNNKSAKESAIGREWGENESKAKQQKRSSNSRVLSHVRTNVRAAAVCAFVVTFTEIYVEINLFASIYFWWCRSFSASLPQPLRALNQLITLNRLVEMKWFCYPQKLILIETEINMINIFSRFHVAFGWLLHHFALAIYNFFSFVCLLFI